VDIRQSPKTDVLVCICRVIFSSENFIRISPLGADLSMSVVRERLDAAGRTLTTGQLSTVEKALSNCSLPLYVRLVSEEVCRWSSYQHDSETVLQQTVNDIINTLFDRLELYHGKVRNLIRPYQGCGGGEARGRGSGNALVNTSEGERRSTECS